MKNRIGLIGGSGFELFKNGDVKRCINFETKWGHSSPIFEINIGNYEIDFCSRHGSKHTIPPSQVNYRANIEALKNCELIIATSACGSLREDYNRGTIIVPDQFIDFTKNRKNTFIDDFPFGKMNHPAMGDPFNEKIRQLIIDGCVDLKMNYRPTGTVVTIEGPRFSTRSESDMFRLWGGDVINMTTATECSLAFEMGIPYATICLVTDYDSWNRNEDPVTHEDVMKVFSENVNKVTELITNIINKL